MKKTVLFLTLVLFFCFTHASVLSDMAAALQDRTFVQMPLNDGLLGLTFDRSLLYWADSGEWDPVNKRIVWMGGPGTCCANPAIYKVMTYDEASDTWDVMTTAYEGSGHAYDGNALNPANGLFYFGKKGDVKVKVWNGSTWSTLPDLPFAGGTTPALSWFPELNSGQGGLVYLGSAGNLAWYNGSAWTRLQYNTELLAYNGFMQYSPVHKIIWFGAGNGSDRIHYKMDARLNITKLKDAPISLNNSQALHSVDPVSGNFIAGNIGDDTWWEFDPVADSWTQISNLNGPNPLGQSGHWFIVPIPEHGVNMIFNHYWEYRRIYLYRHSTPSAVTRGPAAVSVPGPAIQVSPNPFNASTRIRIADGHAAQVDIYDISGKCVERFAPGTEMTWNAGNHAPGVYLIKARMGGRTKTARVLLHR